MRINWWGFPFPYGGFKPLVKWGLRGAHFTSDIGMGGAHISPTPEPDPCSYFGPGTALLFRSRDHTRKTDAFGHCRLTLRLSLCHTHYVIRYPLILARSPVLCNPESGVRNFKFVQTPVLLIAESGTIDPGIQSPVLLSAESGPGGASPGLRVNLSATILNKQ